MTASGEFVSIEQTPNDSIEDNLHIAQNPNLIQENLTVQNIKIEEEQRRTSRNQKSFDSDDDELDDKVSSKFRSRSSKRKKPKGN